jgi:hypothetical protein
LGMIGTVLKVLELILLHGFHPPPPTVRLCFS